LDRGKKGTLIRVFSTSNQACVAELRRGIDQAIIFDLAISPSSTLLAVTSDKSTLHIFDLPTTARKPGSGFTNHDRQRGMPASALTATGRHHEEEDGSRKWGILGKIPLMPRVFSDTYSFASAPFETGDERANGAGRANLAFPKGVIGWLSDRCLLVIGAGRQARWEKFVIGEAPDGRRYCARDGWRNYLGRG
jgi:WD40 repeat protein